MEKTQSTTLVCYHCGDECASAKIVVEDKHFCCKGCKMVYEILSKNDLCDYYDLNETPGLSQKTEVRKGKFNFLNDEKIAQKLVSFTDEKQTHITFYLPQIHCSSCLWLLENIHRINPGIVSSRVNFAKKEAFIVFDNAKTSLEEVALKLTQIGYEPHISLQDVEVKKSSGINKERIYKIGIAGFAFGNTMVLSLPDYFSFVSRWEDNFGFVLNFLKILLTLPVVFYCSTEFFVNAWIGIKNRFLNIHAPLALAIAITFGRSLYEIFSQTGPGYFDSICGLVFLMLVGRAVQDVTYQSISFDRDYKSFFPIAVDVKKNNEFVPTEINDIQVDDIIHIHSNELIPADAILSKGKAEIDYSFVTGESLPVRKNIGEIIYAGGKQLHGNIELMVVKKVSQSYLTSLWNKDIFKQERKENKFVHMLSRYFTFIILSIASIAAIYWYTQGRTDYMWNALTTILIIACPCALLLSATFTNGNILRILSKNKLYLRHPDVIANISQINHIVFDKTGTLTQSRNVLVNYEGKKISDDNLIAIASLLSHSTHPLSNAVFRHLNMAPDEEIVHFKNVVGQGIEGWVNEQYIKIGSAKFVGAEKKPENHSSVFVKIDKEIYGRFIVKNDYRYGFEQMMTQLKNDYKVSVLSGDNDAEKNYLQKLLGQKAELHFNQKPDDKLAYIAHLQENKKERVMMIGDGLNDAGALRQSHVGIALAESNNNFTPASDGIVDASKFAQLHNYLRFTTFGKKIIVTSFALSIIYNIVGISYAVQGIMSPVIAAILMPASSITIVLITYGLSELAGKKYGLK